MAFRGGRATSPGGETPPLRFGPVGVGVWIAVIPGGETPPLRFGPET